MDFEASFLDEQGQEIPLPQELWKDLHPQVKAFILWQQERIRVLEARVKALEEQLGSNSSNSSKPPSSDPPGTLRNRGKSTGKRRGGQKGHRGHHRELVPTEQADHVFKHYPLVCGCGHVFSSQDAVLQEPVRHQVWELPPVQAEVTEHQRHRCCCPECGQVSLAELPPEIPKGSFGPRLAAMVGVLLGGYRLSRRQCETLLADAFGVTISLGGLAGLEALLSESVSAAVEEVQATIQQAPVVNVDDTGWKEENKRAVLWNMNTPDLAFFMISARKDHETARSLLGDFDGILGADRATTYSFHPLEKQATCWAHLDRHFQRMEDRGDESAAIGKWGKAEVDRFFEQWHRFKNGEISREQLQAEVVPIRARMARLLKRGSTCSEPRAGNTPQCLVKTENTCQNILKVFSSLWTCIYHEGVEPTNNSAERALRHPVQWRRTSFGTRSPEGSRFVERMLTATETCRRQGRNLLSFLAESVKAQLLGIAGPSLVPCPDG